MGECVKMSPKAIDSKYSLKKSQKLLSVPKKVNFGRGSGDAGFAMWRISDSINGLLAQILPALMPQCNECPLNSMEHASTEHSVNSYLLLVIQLNGEYIKLWFTLIQTTLYAIMLSCTHHTLPNWSALSLFCLFVCLSVPVSLFPAVDAIVAACVYLCLLYSCWCSRPSRALGLPAREPAWPRLVKILPWSRNALFQTLVETTMHNAHHNAQCSTWNIDNTIAYKILTVVCSIARNPKFR